VEEGRSTPPLKKGAIPPDFGVSIIIPTFGFGGDLLGGADVGGFVGGGACVCAAVLCDDCCVVGVGS